MTNYSVEYSTDSNPAIPSSLVVESASSWMEKLNLLSDSKFFKLPLHRICFPASHDSGMSSAHGCQLATRIQTQTQRLDIGEQLNAGIRYFDLRPTLSNEVISGHSTFSEKKFYFGHFSNGLGCYGQNVKEALQQVKQFLDSNSKEVVILKFRIINVHGVGSSKDKKTLKEDGKGVPEKYQVEILKSIKAALSGKMLTAAVAEKIGLKTLGEILATDRQVVCVFEYLDENLYDPKNGILVYGDISSGINSHSNFDIYDKYSDTNDLSAMISIQNNYYNNFVLNKDKDFPKGSMFLLSHTLTQNSMQAIASTILMDLPVLDMAIKANAKLMSTLTGFSNEKIIRQPPNFIYIDDVNNENCITGATYINKIVIEALNAPDMGGQKKGMFFEMNSNADLNSIQFDLLSGGLSRLGITDVHEKTIIEGTIEYPQKYASGRSTKKVDLQPSTKITHLKIGFNESKGFIEYLEITINNNLQNKIIIGTNQNSHLVKELAVPDDSLICGFQGYKQKVVKIPEIEFISALGLVFKKIK